MFRKAKRASWHIAGATRMFKDAHNKLNRATELLDQAEKDHRQEAAEHLQKADAAKQERERSGRVRDRIAELLS